MSDTDETIQLSGQSSWQDHKHVYPMIMPLRKRIVFHAVVLLFVFIVIAACRPQPPIGPIVFASFATIYFVMLYRLRRRAFVKGQANRVNTQIEIDGNSLLVRNSDQELSFDWSDFETVTRDDRFIVLRGREPGGMPMVILPKSWCHQEGDWAQIEQLVAEWLPPEACVLSTANKTGTGRPSVGCLVGVGDPRRTVLLRPPSTEEAREFRLEHLSAEAALNRSVLLLLALSLVIALVAFVVPFSEAKEQAAWFVFFFRVQSVLATAACCITAWGVRRLAAWSRLPLQILAAYYLLLIPVGTFFGVWVFYLLVAGPKPHLLTPEYEQIVRIAGPMEGSESIRIRPFTWIVLAMVALIIVLASLISMIPEELRHNL